MKDMVLLHKTLQNLENQSSFNINIEEHYSINFKFSLGSVLNDTDFICKNNFLTNDELMTLRLDLIKTCLNNFKHISKYETGVEIKKFFYIHFIFANKFQLSSKLTIFIIENFNKLSNLLDSPYSPNKQKQLYQHHFKTLNQKDKSIPDLEIPSKKLKITIETSSEYNNYNKNTIQANSDSSIGFSFSSDWVSELFKALLETVFAKKIDEEDNKIYNRLLINSFFKNIMNIIESLNNKNIQILLNKLNNKIEDTEVFEIICSSLDKMINILISRGKETEVLVKIILDRKKLIEEWIFKSSSLKKTSATKLVKINLNDSINETINTTKTSNRRNSDGNTYNKSNFFLNWRAINGYLNSIGLILSNNIENYSNDLKYIIKEIFHKIQLNQNYQVEKTLCCLLAKLYKGLSNVGRDDLIEDVITFLAKNKNFYIRRFFIIFCEDFLTEYSFKLFHSTRLYSALLKKLRDPLLLVNTLDLLWKVYPFIESNLELKKELNIQLDFIKASYSQSQQLQGRRNLKNIQEIEKFVEKEESIYSFDIKDFLLKDDKKYELQLEELSKNDNQQEFNITSSFINLIPNGNTIITNPSLKNSANELKTKSYKLNSNTNTFKLSVNEIKTTAVTRKPISSKDIPKTKLNPIKTTPLRYSIANTSSKTPTLKGTVGGLNPIKTKLSSNDKLRLNSDFDKK